MLRKILASIVLSILISFPSYAVDVTNSNPDGAGSLSYAIQQANQGTDTTININHPSVNTITLNRELTIESDVTINGNGVTIEGTNERRLFRITSGHAVFNRITFTKGNAASGNGGAVEIDNSSSWAEFNNCTFFGNTAQGYGGAVCVTNGSINSATVLKQCSIAGNTAGNDGGGAASLKGDVRIYSSIITGNTASYDIYASSENDIKAFYNVTGTSNFTADDTSLTGRSVSDIFMLNDEGNLTLRTVDGVNLLELSGTSIARDVIPANTDYTLSADETGMKRYMLNAYDAGAFEARPVPVDSVDLYGIPYIQINDRGSLSVDVYPENASLNVADYPPDGIEWVSSNPEVLTVDDAGNITAVGVGGGVGEAIVTATTHGWDASGNPSVIGTTAFTVYVGKEPATAIRANITSLDAQTVQRGGHKLVTPKVTLEVSGIELKNIKAGVNYTLTASSKNPAIVTAEIVSNDSIRLLAGDTTGSADVEVVASPEPNSGPTQSMKVPFTVTVIPAQEGDTLGSHHGGCNTGIFGAVFMLVLSSLIYRRG